MTSTRPWYALLRLMPPWIGLCAVTLVLLAVTLTAPIHPTIQEVHGPWKILSPVERNGSTITLPGNFASQGHPSESRLVVERAVTAPGGSLTLWIDRPMYAVRVLWDGVELGRSGDPGHEGDVFRSAASLILPVPDAPADSVHRIVLDIRGDYGDGGIDNGIRIGPSQAVQRAARSAEVRQLSTALGLCVCALIALALAAGRRRDPTHLTLGLLALMLALLTYTRSSHIVDLLPYVVETLRLERAATGPIAPLFVACIVSYLYGAPRKAEEYYLVAGFTLSVIALLIPSDGLRAVALVCNAAALSGILWYGMLCIQAARRWERHNLQFLALVGVPLVLGGASELALSAEWRHGPSYLMASALWLVGGLFVGVLFRDARASDRQRQLLGGSVDAMVCVGPNEVVIDINPAAGRLLGRDAIGRNFLEWVRLDDRPLVRAHITRACIEYDRAEFGIDLGDGLIVESLASPMHAQEVLLVLRDMTQRRLIDRGMLQAARVETVGILLGGIAHDFNNMLGTLLAHVGILQATLEEDEGSQERLTRMESTIARASQLTRRLLTVARGTGADLGPVDLKSVCRQALELVQPTLAAGIHVVVDLPSDLPPVHGSANDLEQVLVNLLMNARDAVDGEGTLRLVARHFDLGPRGRGVALMVEDDGRGVPADMRSEIFHPFVTTKNHGTGLGLAVASQILQDHYGRIWHEDGPETGSRFLIALRHADTVHEAPAPLPEGRKVLLIDDENVLLEDYAKALSAAGYQVTPFSNPLDAARHLETHRPDIVVTDVVMDGLNGLVLATRCQARYPELPILIVSGFVPEIDIPELENGTWHLLHKPVRAARLVSVVGRLRRRAERAERGDLDITRVSYLFPALSDLSSALLGMHRLASENLPPPGTQPQPAPGEPDRPRE